MNRKTIDQELPEEVRNRRLPVWEALSEFFLDTELDSADLERIADILAASHYSELELEDILRYEVYPPCRWNLFIAAGAWSGFGRDWLIKRIAPRFNRRPRLRLPPFFGWTYREYWEKVRPLLRRRRGGTRT